MDDGGEVKTMSNWKVNLYRPRIGPAEADAVAAVLRSGWLSAGAVTRQFEEAFADAAGVDDAIAVSSGTAALQLAVQALGIGPGDEVIMPSLSFVAGASMVALSGAAPVFAEVNGADDLSMSATDVAARITERTRAIITMHYGGYASALPALADLARRHGLALIEDSAHAPATMSEYGRLGTIGDVGCYSFFATKNLAVGEGGMVVARSPELRDRIRRLRSHALTVDAQARHRGSPSSYDVDGFGFNHRPNEVTSAIGLAQLNALASGQRRRQEIVQDYRRGLADLAGIGIPYLTRDVEHSAHHLFPIILPTEAVRAEFQNRLAEAGIQSGIHYPPSHLFTAYQQRFGYRAGSLPVTEDVCSHQVSLPLYVDLSPVEVELVIAAVRQAWGAM
ncbi:DegT/DnrJ/EryC1/StrS family aminotransferase [Micromonospora sp. NPDC000089]|uniref:DegT/DnrJ/EryC1/StrS family aminotransferase n=1 Tax=unclassified Micromonospora TaxID=2617518 RepID=UPI0036C16EC9